MRFPPSFLERLRSQLLVSEVIGRRIAIKKHGREFQALCPFHNEKTPSFTINDDKGFYHCFGCGAHGDAIGFTMKYDRLTYPEAVERLARDAGIPMPEMTREEMVKAEKEKTQISVCDAACHWFESQLKQHYAARDYVEKRNLSEDTVRKFRIGYAPDMRDGLYQHLLKNGYSAAQMLETGLIIQPEEGGVYDRFRGRVMFPIRSPRGDVIAFGGRLIDSNNKNLPKYLNSPETSLFKKSETLYNLDQARQAARERKLAVVLEGYMDVVSVAQAGVHYAVATLGTAVTAPHLAMLWKLCQEPVLCLDGDEAGKRAMSRAAEVALPLLKPGCSLRFAILPRGEDPDSYVQKHGRAAFENIVQNAQPLYQSLWEDMERRYRSRIGLPEGRAEFEAALSRLAENIGDAAVRKHYAGYFKNQLWEYFKKTPRAAAPRRAPQVAQLSSLEDMGGANAHALVARMLQLLAHFPLLLHKSAVDETLSHLDIRDVHLAALRDALLSSLEDASIENRDTLLGYLERTLPQYDVRALTAADASVAALPADAAWQLWNDTVVTYKDEIEAAELQRRLEREWNETDQARLKEIKARQSRRGTPPPASDVA